MFADSQYLQDIGTQTYTEYEFGPDYFAYLMANPQMMDFKQGHLHSHNNFDVFFSGTDDAELITNSEFHNYYLSLIVNNKNEMTARVAFRVTKRSSIAKYITSTLEYRDVDGNLKSTPAEPTEAAEEKVDVTVYYFECDIIKPQVAIFDPVLSARIDAIEETKRQARAAKSTSGAYSGYTPKSYGNFDDDWEMGKDVDWARDKNIRTGAKGNSSVGKSFKMDQRELFDVEEKGNRGSKKDIAKSVRKMTGEDRKSAAFLTALLTGDPLCPTGLPELLDQLDDKLDSKYAVMQMVEEVNKQLLFVYMALYPEDMKLDGVKEVIESAIEVLGYYEDTYDYFVTPICEELTQQIRTWN